MNKQRRVLITTTYNEMGIIIDTKAEEVSNDSPELDSDFGDLISRAAALSAITKRMEEVENPFTGNGSIFWEGMCIARSIVGDLPSAETHGKSTEKRTETHACDCISRKAAIECLEHLSACDEPFVEIGTGDETFIGKYEAITEISDLPSAQPTQCNSGNILRHPQCANRTNLGNCDPVGGFCNSVPKEICDAQPQPEPQSRMVFGYSMEYLVAFAEACRRANVDESDLKTFANNCTFAYATMAEEYRQQINQAIDAFMGNARGTNESD